MAQIRKEEVITVHDYCSEMQQSVQMNGQLLQDRMDAYAAIMLQATKYVCKGKTADVLQVYAEKAGCLKGMVKELSQKTAYMIEAYDFNITAIDSGKNIL